MGLCPARTSGRPDPTQPDAPCTDATIRAGRAVREPEVGAAELVGRADEEVAAERLHVGRRVRRVLHRVHPAERSGGMRELGDAGDVDDRPDGVRRRDAGDDAHPVVQLPLEIVQIEAQVGGDVHPVELEAAVGRQLDPRRHAAVVVEPRDEDPVALAPVARCCPRQREVEHGHVLAEDHVVGGAVEEAGGVVARRREDSLDAVARLVERADVRRGFTQGARDRVADLVRHLRAARRVEEDEAAVAQRGEARSNGFDVQ